MMENCFNPLTPMSYRDGISSYKCQYNIEQASNKSKEKYHLGDYGRSNTKFSELTSSEFYSKENYWWDLGSEKVK